MRYSDDNLIDASPRSTRKIPGAIQLHYGQLEIGHYDGDKIRLDVYTRNCDGVKLTERCHVTGRRDTSPRYTGDYNADCSWCYLGYTHSINAHKG
jgi:hypothetical protein